MTTQRITKRAVDALKSNASEFTVWDDAITGFGVRVRPTGAKSYVVVYRAGAGRGAPVRRYTIATVGKIAPERARARAKVILGLVAHGHDPADQKTTERGTPTVAELADRFMAEHVEAKRKAGTAEFYRDILARLVKPAVGTTKADKLTRLQVGRLHSALAQTPFQANRMLAVVGSMYAFACRAGMVPEDVNPARRVEKFKESRRERFLTGEELERLGSTLREAETTGIPWIVDESRPTAKHVPKAERFTTIGRRAAAVAREIVTNRVDLVGLQEATIIRKGTLQIPTVLLPATTLVSDNLQLLLEELEELGEPYHVVAIVPGLDAELPTALGFDARVTLRDVIIARSHNSDLRLSNVQVQSFLANRTFATASGVPLPDPRGWASVDVEKNGRKFRFATAHLEEPHPVQTPQAHDMINGAGNTTLPVVFAGDFNVVANNGLDPTFPVYQKFINAGFVDAWPLKRAPDPGLTCCQAANLLNSTSQVDRRIDLVLFRGAVEVLDIRLVGQTPGDRTPSGLWPSDHAGVVATLRVPKTTDHQH